MGDISDVPGDRCRTGRLAQEGQPFGAEGRHAPAAARFGPNQRSTDWRTYQEPNQSFRSLFSSNSSYRALWSPPRWIARETPTSLRHICPLRCLRFVLDFAVSLNYDVMLGVC